MRCFVCGLGCLVSLAVSCFGADERLAALKQLPQNPKLNFSAKGSHESRSSKGNKDDRSNSFEISMDGNQLLHISDLSDFNKALGKVVKAKNDRYLFAIQRGGKGADSVTTIESAESPKGKELWESELKSNVPLNMLLLGSQIGGIPLGAFVSSPRFRLISIDVLEESGLWRVDYTYDFGETGTYLFGYEASYFICDPSNNFFISESEYNTVEGEKRSKTQYKESMTPGVASGGVTLTQSVVRTVKHSSGIVDTFKGNSESSLDLDPRAFYLSYYGFAEPNFQRGYAVWWWLGAVGAVAIIWYYVRRRKLANA